MKSLDELLGGARRASEIGMTDEESALVWERVRVGPPGRALPARWIAGIGAALLAAVGLMWPNRPAPIEIVKEVRFESVHDGKVVRFEMTVYREEKKEKNDVPKPSH